MGLLHALRRVAASRSGALLLFPGADRGLRPRLERRLSGASSQRPQDHHCERLAGASADLPHFRGTLAALRAVVGRTPRVGSQSAVADPRDSVGAPAPPRPLPSGRGLLRPQSAPAGRRNLAVDELAAIGRHKEVAAVALFAVLWSGLIMDRSL